MWKQSCNLQTNMLQDSLTNSTFYLRKRVQAQFSLMSWPPSVEKDKSESKSTSTASSEGTQQLCARRTNNLLWGQILIQTLRNTRGHKGQQAALFPNTAIMTERERLLTCDHGGVVLSTGDVLHAAATEVLQWFWQIDLEQKCSMTQLTVLTPAKRVHAVLCSRKTDTTTMKWADFSSSCEVK